MRHIKTQVQPILNTILATNKDVSAVRFLEDVEKSPEGRSAIPREMRAVVVQFVYPPEVVCIVRIADPATTSTENRLGDVGHPVEDLDLGGDVGGGREVGIQPLNECDDRCLQRIVTPSFSLLNKCGGKCG